MAVENASRSRAQDGADGTARWRRGLRLALRAVARALRLEGPPQRLMATPMGENLRIFYVGVNYVLLVSVAVLNLFSALVETEFPSLTIATLALVVLLQKVLFLGFLRREIAFSAWMANFTVDLVAMTVALHLAGGVEAVVGPLFYLLFVVLVGLLLTPRAAYVSAAACAVSYVSIVWAEYCGWLPHRVSDVRPPDRQILAAISVVGSLFMTAWIVSFVVRHIHDVYEAAERTREEAVHALSHDLKNPLFAIAGFTEMLRDATAAEASEYRERILFSTQLAEGLVRNVLDAAASDAGALEPVREPVSVGTILRNVTTIHSFAAAPRGVRLVVINELGEAPFRFDPQLLTRALGNLVSNAIKYSPRDATVTIRAASEGSAVVSISVRDAGPGIPKDRHARLFQKFSRLQSERRVEGTGLGLYVVRRIIEAHGGTVSCESAPDQGSTFSIRLPVDRTVSAG